MRIIMLAVVTALLGSALPVRAEGTPEPDRSLRDMLPLFEANRCVEIRDTAGQLFCGDPELRNAGTRLNVAVEARLNRIADRRVAIEENVEWIRSRNLSCGIFERQGGLASLQISAVKPCLLRETQERIGILEDPNFDCLATNTAAGELICGDPSLAIADKELNSADARADRKNEGRRGAECVRRICQMDPQPRPPLQPRRQGQRAAEGVVVVGSLPGGIYRAENRRDRRRQRRSEAGVRPPDISRTPDADAVDLCVAQIHAANACSDFLRISRIIQIDTEVSAEQALVTAEVEMKVVSPFAVCSPIASSCTGTCWDLRSGLPKSAPGSRDSLPVAHRLRIEKSFAFQKADNGDWRCNTPVLQPIELGVALRGP